MVLIQNELIYKQIIRLKEVILITGLSKSTIYAKLNRGTNQYDTKFPKRIKLGARAVGWLKEDVLEWLNSMQYESVCGESHDNSK